MLLHPLPLPVEKTEEGADYPPIVDYRPGLPGRKNPPPQASVACSDLAVEDDAEFRDALSEAWEDASFVCYLNPPSTPWTRHLRKIL